MRAMVYRGPGRIRVEAKDIPAIEHPNDAIVRVTTAAICGSDPDNVIAETGVLSEFRNQAYRRRFGQHRADLKHQPIDLVMWAAPYAAVAAGIYLAIRGLNGRA